MVINQIDGRSIKFVKKIITPQSEFMHTKSVGDIIELNRMWNFKYIFVDAGYGHVSVELLKKHGVENPASRLAEKVIEIYMNKKIEIISPINGEKITKFAKPYMVDQTVKLLEDGCLVLPVNEDYGYIGEGASDVGLVEQMRNFKVERYSVHNLPTYSQGEEHTLTAFMLACAFWIYKEGPLKQLMYSNRVLSLPVSTDRETETTLSEKEMLETMKKYRLTRTSGKVNITRKSPSTRDLDLSMKSTMPGRRGPSFGNRHSYKSPKRKSF